ncbi:MAG TPA: hypothetical protein VN737_23285 [Bryobacteraceae bacterium]|nr:hypothetical protein [Bryobacteraceae bacterium]
MRIRFFQTLPALLLAGCAFGQTQLDLRTQSKSVDFSSSPSTRPVQVGTTLPASCQTGQLFFKSDATAGLNLYGCTATNAWTVQSGGAPGTAATMISQLGDLQVTRTSNTVLTIGASCSTATPCNVHFGTTVYSIASTSTATISGSATGMLYIYVTNAGVLTVGSNLSVACSSCSAQSGVTSFPPDSIALETWPVTNGALNAAGGQDFRALLGTKNVVAGQGIVTTDANGSAVVSVDSTLIGLRVATPGSSTSACDAGSWSYDANYIYICTAPNTWRRAQLASW